MTDKAYGILIEGTNVVINFTAQTRTAIKDLGLDEYPIYGTLLSMGKVLLEMKDREQFIIIDEFQSLGIVGIKDAATIAVDIIAVVPKERIFIKRGTKVHHYGKDDEIEGCQK